MSYKIQASSNKMIVPPKPMSKNAAGGAYDLSSAIVEGKERISAYVTKPGGPSKILPPEAFPASSAYHIPRTMVEKRGSPADLWIDVKMPTDELGSKLAAYLQRNEEHERAKHREHMKRTTADGAVSEIVSREIYATKRMTAELSGGTAFDIDPKGAQELNFVDGQTMKWSWIVTPLEASGPDGSILEIRVVAYPGDARAPFEPLRERVIVYARERTFKEWFLELDFWIKALGGGGITVFLTWILSRFRALFQKKKDT